MNGEATGEANGEAFGEAKSGMLSGGDYFLFWKFKIGARLTGELMAKNFPQYFLFW